MVATSTSSSPAAKARITASFSSAGSRPCSTPIRSPCSGPSASSGATSSHRERRPPAVVVLRRRRPPRRRPRRRSAGTPRTPGGRRPTSSRSRRQARSRKAGFSAAGTTCEAIGERPRGQLGERGDLQVAVDGHRHRARDRGGGHHQHVRRLARPWPAARRAARRRSGAARRPPPGRGRRSRPPRRAARGCRARCRPRPAGDLGQRPAAGRRAQRAGDQRHPGGRRRRRPARRPGPSGPSRSRMPRWCWAASTSVGREQRRLPAGVDHLEHRPQRAPRVLPEPTSPCSSRCIGCAVGQVGGDLLADGALAVGQLVRQPARRTRRAARRRARGRGIGRPVGRPVLALHQGQLHGERLVPLEPAAAPGTAPPWLDGRWISRSAVPRPTSLRSARTVAGSGSSGGVERVQHHPHAAGDHPGRHGRRRPGRPGSARRRTPRSPRCGRLAVAALAEQHVLRAVELPLAPELGDLAGEQPPPARAQLAARRQAWLPKKVQVSTPPEPSPTVTSSRLPRRWRIGRDVGALHLGQHGDLLADLQRADVGVLAALVVAAREVVDQVAGGVQVEVRWPAPWRSSSPTSFFSGVSTVAGCAHSTPTSSG